MSIYKNFYDNITPEKSNEQFADSIINAKKPKMKTSPKKITAAAIAAATGLAVTVTGYASGWDYGAVFNEIFGEKSANIQTHLVTEATEVCDDIDHLDFEIAAAAADRQGVLVIIDITPQNGLPEELPADIFDDLRFGIYYEESHRGSAAISPIEYAEEKIRVSIRAYPRENIAGEKISVYAHGKSKWYEGGKDDLGYYTGYGNYWRAEFTADYEGNELEYPADLTYTGNYGGTFHIDRIVVTPISVYAIGEKSNSKDLLSVKEEYDYNLDQANTFAVTSSNGALLESYAITNNGENTDEKEINKENIVNFHGMFTDYLGENNGEDLISMSFGEPINPEDITAVVIGGTVIELK